VETAASPRRAGVSDDLPHTPGWDHALVAPGQLVGHRWERHAELHLAFMHRVCAFICQRFYARETGLLGGAADPGAGQQA
jgi:hypothetical protein